MGQYFNAVLIEKCLFDYLVGKSQTPPDFLCKVLRLVPTDNKMLEHCDLNSKFMNMVTKFLYEPTTDFCVLWMGDYIHYNEIINGVDFGLFVDKFKENKRLYEETCIFESDFDDEIFCEKAKFCCNATKNVFFDMTELKNRREDFHPLPIMTNVGEISAGGVYKGLNIELSRIWGGDHIFFTDKVPEMMTKLDPRFVLFSANAHCKICGPRATLKGIDLHWDKGRWGMFNDGFCFRGGDHKFSDFDMKFNTNSKVNYEYVRDNLDSLKETLERDLEMKLRNFKISNFADCEESFLFQIYFNLGLGTAKEDATSEETKKPVEDISPLGESSRMGEVD